jgi:hypothetical protein
MNCKNIGGRKLRPPKVSPVVRTQTMKGKTFKIILREEIAQENKKQIFLNNLNKLLFNFLVIINLIVRN